LDYFKKNASHLIENPPATTWAGVRELAFPSMLIEIGDIVTITPKQKDA
jgi:hypothetical protein